MKNLHILAALLLALPIAAQAQTKTTTTTKPTTTTTTVPATTPAGTTTEVTEELDPTTGKVIRRTTRTINNAPGTGSTATADIPSAPATDTQVTDFFREKTNVSTLSGPALLDAYSRFMDKVRNERSGWKPANWTAAASVLSSLNARYQQLRSTFSLDDKVTIRSQQAEFQALRTARQLSDQVSDKL